MEYELVIVGGGPAGLSAAIEAYELGIRKILILERNNELGGILQQCIHNGFGLHEFKEELTGPEYAGRFIRKVKALNIEYKCDTLVMDITSDKIVHAINSYDGYMLIQAKAIILAMGCRERSRGEIHIPGTRPAGVITAGTAQYYLNMQGYMVGKKVFILGSGDIGLIMARRMTLEGAQVLGVAEVLPYSGGLKRNIVQCLNDFNIPLYLSHTITEIRGKNRITGITLAKVDERRKPIAGTEMSFEVDALLLSVGLIPDNELSEKAHIQLNSKTRGAVVDENMATSNEGVFACGNVLHVHDLVDYVSEESRRAAKGAAKYIQGLLQNTDNYFTTEAGKGISYIVPQVIHPDNMAPEGIPLLFRSTGVYHQVKVILKSGDQIIKEIKKAHLAPAEMENILLTKELATQIKGQLTVEILEEVVG